MPEPGVLKGMDIVPTTTAVLPNAPPGKVPVDPDLVPLLLADRDRGFEEVVRRYQRDVYSVAVRLCAQLGNSDAEDLSAETFLRAYRALVGYDGERIAALRVRPWLLTILLNTWRNLVRTAARRPRQEPLASALAVSPTGASAEPLGPGAAEVFERGETSRELADLLTELPERQRLAVVLRHVVGLPVAEVAEVLRLPENTVKSHTARGLATLRSLYTEPGRRKEKL